MDIIFSAVGVLVVSNLLSAMGSGVYIYMELRGFKEHSNLHIIHTENGPGPVISSSLSDKQLAQYSATPPSY